MKLESLKKFKTMNLTKEQLSSVQGGKVVGKTGGGSVAIASSQSASGTAQYSSDTVLSNGVTAYSMTSDVGGGAICTQRA